MNHRFTRIWVSTQRCGTYSSERAFNSTKEIPFRDLLLYYCTVHIHWCMQKITFEANPLNHVPLGQGTTLTTTCPIVFPQGVSRPRSNNKKVTWKSAVVRFSDRMILVGKSDLHKADTGLVANAMMSELCRASGLMLASRNLSTNSLSVLNKSVRFDCIAQNASLFRNVCLSLTRLPTLIPETEREKRTLN